MCWPFCCDVPPRNTVYDASIGVSPRPTVPLYRHRPWWRLPRIAESRFSDCYQPVFSPPIVRRVRPVQGTVYQGVRPSVPAAHPGALHPNLSARHTVNLSPRIIAPRSPVGRF